LAKTDKNGPGEIREQNNSWKKRKKLSYEIGEKNNL